MLRELQPVDVCRVNQLRQTGKDETKIGERFVAALPMIRGRLDRREGISLDGAAAYDRQQSEQPLAIRVESEPVILRHTHQKRAGSENKPGLSNRNGPIGVPTTKVPPAS